MIALAKPDNLIGSPWHHHKSNEWYTPQKYIEAARGVMGSIDLDPASCVEANLTVRATKIYAIKDNGLDHPWHGNVWLNPPYGRVDNKSVMGMFIAKLLESYYQGDVTQAVLLATGRTDNKQLNRLWEFPICFTDHHINFYCPTPGHRNSVSHMHGSTFVYLGPHEQKFIEVFSKFGYVVKNVSPPKVQPINLSLWEVQHA